MAYLRLPAIIALLSMLAMLCVSAAQSTGQTIQVNIASNPIDAGQSTVVSANISGLTFTNATYAWSASGCPDFTDPGNVTSFTYTSTSSGLTTTCQFAVSATDSQGDSGSGTSSILTVNPALGTPDAPTFNSTVDFGQSEEISSVISSVNGTGSGTITYTLYYSNSSTGQFNQASGSSCSASGSTAACSYAPSSSGTFYYEITATDQAATPETTTSPVSASQTVNPRVILSMQAPTLTSGTYGQTDTLSGTISGGDGTPYTVSSFKDNVVGALSASDCAVSGTSVSCTVQLPPVQAPVQDAFTITVMDSLGEQASNSTTVTINLPSSGSTGGSQSSSSTTTIIATTTISQTSNLTNQTTTIAPGYKITIPVSNTTYANATNTTNSTNGTKSSASSASTGPVAVAIPVSIGVIAAIVAGYMLTRSSRPRRRR